MSLSLLRLLGYLCIKPWKILFNPKRVENLNAWLYYDHLRKGDNVIWPIVLMHIMYKNYFINTSVRKTDFIIMFTMKCFNKIVNFLSPGEWILTLGEGQTGCMVLMHTCTLKKISSLLPQTCRKTFIIHNRVDQKAILSKL